MHQVKFAPLGRSQRAEDRVVSDWNPPPEASFQLADRLVHANYVFQYFALDLLDWGATRFDSRRRFAA